MSKVKVNDNKATPQVAKKCFNCGQKGHLAAACRGQVAVARPARTQVPLPRRDAEARQALRMTRQAPKSQLRVAASVAPVKQVENRLERAMHAGQRVGARRKHAGGFEHGYVEHTGFAKTKHGTAHVFEGCERIAGITAAPDTARGKLLDFFLLNPEVFGPYTKLVCKAMAKFVLTEVELITVNYVNQFKPATEGVVYFGMQPDPNDEFPYGQEGLNTMVEWKGPHDRANYFEHTLTNVNTVRHKFDLDHAAQSPLFIRQNGDERFEAQGRVILMSGSALNVAGAGVLGIGEYFIRFKVHLYDLATTPADLGMGAIVGWGELVKPPNTTVTTNGSLSQFTKWFGKTDMLIQTDFAATGVSFILPNAGTYMWSGIFQQNLDVGAASLFISDPILEWFQVDGIQDPEAITGEFITCTNGPAANGGEFNLGYQVASQNAANAIDTGHSMTRDVGGVLAYWPVATTPGISWQIVFTTDGGTPFRYRLPNNANLNSLYGCMSLVQLDATYHPDGYLPSRPVAANVDRPNDERVVFRALSAMEMTKPVCTDADFLKITKYIEDNRTSLDPGMVNYMIRTLGLPLKAGPAPMIAPAVVAALAWAASTFGPIILEKAVDWVSGKIRGDDKEPRKTDHERRLEERRRRVPSKRRPRREDDDDEIEEYGY